MTKQQEIDLIEKLADVEHNRWSSWMKYMFSTGKFNSNGTWTMSSSLVERWEGQMNTSYSDLSEKEKDSDRIEVRKTIETIVEYLVGLLR